MLDHNSRHVATWARYLVMGRCLRQVVWRFAARGISVLPVKGILLSEQLYGSCAQRPMADIDILVKPTDFARALAAVRDAGWPRFWDSRQLLNANFVVDGIAVDMAATVGPPGTTGVGVAEFLSRATCSSKPFGFAHLHPEWHDHMLLMCVDAFKDKFGGKPWARADLLRMANAPHFDPNRLVSLAHEAGLTTMLRIVTNWVLQKASPAWARVKSLLPTTPARASYERSFAALVQRTGPNRRTFALGVLTRAVPDHPVRRACAVMLGAAGAAVHHLRRTDLSYGERRLE